MSAKYSRPPLSPSVVVNDGAAAIEFYKKAFGVEEVYRLIDPETGKIGHAEITINGVLVMLGEEYAGMNKSPRTLGGTTVNLGLMSTNAKADFERAVSAGAVAGRSVLRTSFRPSAGSFWSRMDHLARGREDQPGRDAAPVGCDGAEAGRIRCRLIRHGEASRSGGTRFRASKDMQKHVPPALA